MQTDSNSEADQQFQAQSPQNPFPPPQGYASGIGQPGYYPQQQNFINNDVPIVQSTSGILAPQKQFPYQANGLAYPAEINCPKCKKRNMTKIETEFGAGTYAMAYIIFLLTGYNNFDQINEDYFECKDKVHKCSNCDEVVGIRPYNIC